MKMFVSALALAIATPALAQIPASTPTAAEADGFVAQAEKDLAALAIPSAQAHSG